MIRASIRAAIALAIITAYQVVVRHGLFLRTLLVTDVTDNPPPQRLDLGWLNVLQFKLIYLLRFAARRQFAFPGWFRRVEAATLRRLDGTTPEVRPLPELRLEDTDPDRFYRDYVLGGQPVVIRGGMRDTAAFERWDLDWLHSLRDAAVNIDDGNADAEISGTLGDALDSRGTNQRMYVYGATNLMRDRPELVEQLGVRRFERFLARRKVGYVGSQLFAGVHTRTGVGWHCATGNNLFFMVRGRKRWRFAHPDYTWMLYPLLNRTCQTLMSPIGLLTNREYPESWLREHYPLALRMPQYEVTLEPGDLLFNPAWYWHAVENLTEVSIAVSSRWLPPPQVSFNRLTETCMLFSGHITRRKFELLRDGAYEISDENSRDVYRTKDDRIDFGRPGATRDLIARTGMEALPRIAGAPVSEFAQADRREPA
jgi:hypothetical protein